MRIVINGGMGRMGNAAARAFIENNDRVVVVDPAATEGAGEGIEFHASFETVQGKLDCIVDFSSSRGVVNSARAAEELHVPLVVGVTALDGQAIGAIDSAAGKVPVLVAPNLSLGVLVLKKAAVLAAGMLADYDIEIVETHHRYKADAPSGTAMMLANALAEHTGRHVVANRQGARQEDEIGVVALRGGGVVGDHSVKFLGDLDGLEISHRAFDRRVLARGTVFFTHRIAGRAPGRYVVDDLV